MPEDAVRLSAAVMTHPSRSHLVTRLTERLPELAPSIASDPRPDLPPSALRSARLAWQAVAPDATHHLLLQDDVRPCPGFAGKVLSAVAARPDDVLSFFTEWGSRTSHAVRLATLTGSSWVEVLDEYVPTQAVVMPAHLAREFAEHCATVTDQEAPDDAPLLQHLRAVQAVPYVSVPNLVEHLDAGSLVGNDVVMGPRPAALYWDGALPIWTGVADLAVVPHLTSWEGYSVCHVRDSATGRWRKVQTHKLLASLGYSPGNLLERYLRAMAGVTDAAAIRDVVSDSVLLQLWVTAFGYGMVARGLVAPDTADPPQTTLAEAVSRPMVAAGLATFAPGALRRVVPRHRLGGLAMLLRPLLDAAMGEGFTIHCSLGGAG